MSNVIHLLTGRPIGSLEEVLPAPGECLPCFVGRMVATEGCTGAMGWVEQFRVHRAKRATALVRRLVTQGACCDCTLVDAVWQLSPGLWEWTPDGQLVPPLEAPPCEGVRPNSTQPCAHWVSPSELAM
ncbi:hypothetical protein N864_19625 [Intrasporangium chromatireducens Q5-1]|uniref:DUF2695 domain-containing protein n=1 Tax=Intrasporangium chromatireducens Q5-1 TaxID=584657 RepID=W9GSP9_9MICO|nr:DUF2695 domain-containing protein [Intrasporangium chromatireducens]EWT07858.1 hypothetical protein N864_19625 [Intrasporangium chromatireducens Q5-1]